MNGDRRGAQTTVDSRLRFAFARAISLRSPAQDPANAGHRNPARGKLHLQCAGLREVRDCQRDHDAPQFLSLG